MIKVNKKVTMVLAFGLAVCMLLVWMFYGDKKVNNDEDTNSSYLVLGDASIWKYEKENKWKKMNAKTFDKKVKVDAYNDNNYLGYYNLKYVNVWNIVDDNGSFVNNDEDFLGATKGLVTSVDNFESSTLLDDEKENVRVLMDYGYSVETISGETLSVDLNNDGVNEKVVYASNMNEEGLDDYFSLLYVDIDGNIDVLFKKEFKASVLLDEPSFRIYAVVQVKGMPYKNIILHKNYNSEAGSPGYLMYQYSDGNYQLSIED